MYNNPTLKFYGYKIYLVLFINTLLLLFSALLYADTIYQWTDPWGNIQYSKTAVPGSSVSDLKELPPKRKVTESQKQNAMLRKIWEIDQINTLRKNKHAYKKQLQFQKRKSDELCRKLRNYLADVRERNTRQYYWQRFYYPDTGLYYKRYTSEYYIDPYYYQDQFMEQDMERDIRSYCR